MNNMDSFLNRLCDSPILRGAAAALVALGWSSLAFCGEIHDAVIDGNLEKVKALLKENPDLVFSRDRDDRDATPLHDAAFYGWKDVAALLLANHADANVRDTYGETPLHYAASSGRRGAVKLLLANHADINAKNEDGWTPLHFALLWGRKDMMELLLANKAEASIQEAAAGGDLGKVKALLRDRPALVFSKDHRARTPLHYAAVFDRKDVAEFLLANHADVDARDDNGQTPLHRAARFGHKDVAELLLADKADVNARDNHGDTPLGCATAKGHVDMAELLRQHGGR